MITVLLSLPSTAADILLGDTTICVGTEAQLEIVGDFETISWSPAATLSCDNCPNPRATPTETTTYTASFEESNGQIGSLSITVFLPEIKQIADLTICKNTPVTLDAGSEFIGFEYSWEPASLFSCSDCPNPTLLNNNATGPLTIRYSLSSPFCTLIDSFELTILDADGPVYDILDDARFCAGDAFDIGGPNDPGTFYTWTSDPIGLVSTSSNPNVSPTVSTDYFLEVTKVGCSVTTRDTVRAILSMLPEINFATNLFEICEGDTIDLTSGLTSESDVRYAWTPVLGLEDATSINTRAYPTMNTIFTLTGSKGVCERREDITVNVIPNNVNITQDSALICRGEMLQLTATGAPDPDAIMWSPAAGLDVTMGDTVNVTDLRGEFYIYARTENGACSAVDSIFYRVDSLPVDMGIMPQDTTICEGEFVILRSPVFEPANFPDIVYLWTPEEGGNYQTGDTLYNVVVTPTDTTDYVRYVANGACFDSSLVTVNVQPVETIQVTPADTTICAGESFQYQILSENLMDFEWTPSGGLSCGDCDNPVAMPPGSVEFVIEAVDNKGCPVMGSASVTVVPPPSLNFGGTGLICPGEFVTLNESAIPGITYSWTSTDPDFTDTNDPTPFAQPAGDATYTAVLSGPFCADVTETININVIPRVALRITDNPTICPGDEATLTADAGGVSGRFSWNTGDTGASITVQPNQTTNYTVTYSNQCQTLVTTGTVLIEDDFNPGIIPDPARTTVNLGESIDLNLSTALGADQIQSVMWTENGQDVGNGATINVRPPLEGANEYIVKVTTINGCMKEGVIVIFAIVPSVIIPNAFTPNNDGLNDELNIVRIVGDIEVSSFLIFDRWGNKVYEDSVGGWDGSFNGKPMPSDVYVYLAEITFPDGTVAVQKGEISLIR